MHRLAGCVAHQRKTAREHAAVGQCCQQLAAMDDAGFTALHRGHKCPACALGETQRTFAVARDRMALGLRIGKFRGFEPDLKSRKAIPFLAQQCCGRKRDAFAGYDQAVSRLCHLSAQHLQRQPGAQLREAPVMRVGVGFQSAGQGSACVVEPLARDRQQFA